MTKCGSALVVFLLSACEQNGQSTLHPRGPGAESIAELWWLMLAAGGVVFLIVMAALARALVHRGHRDSEPAVASDSAAPVKWIVTGGVVLPVIVLVPLLIVTLQALDELSTPRDESAPQVVITGKQWWWDVQYTGGQPADRVRTANEIHVPVGKPVRIQLASDDVIHSFWVPVLQGKLDLVPGQVNTTWIQADSAGVYRGLCAEYCGLQHALMQFRVIAQPAAEFESWLEEQRKPARPASDSLSMAGQEVFMKSGCALCHAVRGTAARAVTGPDLTHFAGRSTIAAGTLPNSKGHLSGWIGNPQGIKPGNLMPRVPLQPDELEALVAYLSSLR